MSDRNRPEKKKGQTSAKRFLKTLFSRKIVILAAVGVVIFVFCAVFASFLTPYDPSATDSGAKFAPCSAEHLLGADQFGRDTLTRLIYGARVSLIVGVLAVAIACVIGVALGLCAAYFGGWVDIVIMRCCEAIISIPSIMVSVSLIAVFGHSIADLAIILGLTSVPMYTRMMRGQALSIKNSDYIKAGQISGGKSIYMMLRHVLPNSISPMIVMMTQQVGATILIESGLSYLGVGITIPTPSWGTMVSDGKNYLISNPLLAIAPGVCVALLVICLNVLGDGIRDALDPRLRGEL